MGIDVFIPELRMCSVPPHMDCPRNEGIVLAPSSAEIPQVDGKQGNHSSPSSKLPRCKWVSLIAFWLSLLFLGLTVGSTILSIRLFGFVFLQFEIADPKAKVLDTLAEISWFAFIACNAVAFIASVRGRAINKSHSVVILCFSGIWVVLSVAWVFFRYFVT